ncbi:MAG: DinB family protein [Planctomycetota bacterium]
MSDLRDTGLFVLEFGRRASEGFLGGLEGAAFFKLFAEGGGNAAYAAGHIAFTDDSVLTMIAGQESELTEAEKTLFGGGATPSEQPSDYPSRQRILELFAERREKLLAYFRGLGDDELTAAVEGPMAQFGDTRAKLMASLAWHEAMHAGQLTVIRRQQGLPRVFG